MTRDRKFEWGGLSAGRADFVTAAEALAVLEQLIEEYSDLSAETGLADGDAFLRLSAGDRWAVVSTPGTRWFSVRVESGHRARLDDATSTRDEAVMLLGTYVAVGAAYVRGEAVVDGDRRVVTTHGRTISLTRPPAARVRRWLARTR
ncbi:hypothetical protein [Microbacterium sp. RURRCA19A]|uniref:hypothetical protein n=1 Tax=Microbacterium sp. RURRCA19A TaxID=1907391 RepID=UPI000956D6D3|nr:hypothetical protein [Microbacterium sp. RURRCA19A]SIR69636.1 hypothetical protein SAMN05880568_1023 [Microbacterium sp. RURRCA19A]